MPARSSARKSTVQIALVCVSLSFVGCQDGVPWFGRADDSPPDSLPALLNDSLPFDYPIALYLQLIDDSVTLRLHVNEFGRPVPESTAVAVPATHAAFDTAAIDGSRELIFRPAIRRGKAIAHTIHFPINFRIPTVPRLPGDTAFRRPSPSDSSPR
jgi:TonB family protein